MKEFAYCIAVYGTNFFQMLSFDSPKTSENQRFCDHLIGRRKELLGRNWVRSMRIFRKTFQFENFFYCKKTSLF